jgi:hypothetical protein
MSNELESFLLLRREALIVAQGRVFLGSQETIPELPALPGFYEPRRRPVPVVRLPHRDSSSSPRDSHGRIKARGDLQVGQIVPTFFGKGAILGYIDKGEDPMLFLPSNTPIWQVSGCRSHSPANVSRYAIQTIRNRHPWFLFTKAVTLERTITQLEANHG